MDVDSVLLFLDVVDCGGFSQAAARRGVAHSTVSRRVKGLEESLGVPLMTRTTRTRQLTPAGEAVVRHARAIGDSLKSMRAELEVLESVAGGELRVAALEHVGASLVMPALDRYRARHPAVSVQLRFSDGALDFHGAGLDLAITVGLPSAATLVVRRLCANEVCWVASPNLVARMSARHGAPTAPHDLLAWPLVGYRSAVADVLSWRFEGADGVQVLEVEPAITVTDGVTLLSAVRRGLGLGYLSRFSAADDLASGRLVEVLPEVVLPPYDPLYVARADLALVSPRVTAFEACLREVVDEMGLAA